MKTGIILEIDDHFLTVLTPDGEFLRAQNERHPYQVGQEIEFFPIIENEKKSTLFTKWQSTFKAKACIAATIMILIGGASLIPVYKSNQVYAYMSIDDKSNIELAVNKNFEVIGINAYNKQGEEIVNKIDNWKKEGLSTVSSEILKEMEKQELLNDQIVFSTTLNDNHEKAGQLKREVNAIKQQANLGKASLVIVNGTKEERKKAKEKGITLGQYKQPKLEKKSKRLKNKQEQTITTPTPKPKTENQPQLQNQSRVAPAGQDINQPIPQEKHQSGRKSSEQERQEQKQQKQPKQEYKQNQKQEQEQKQEQKQQKQQKQEKKHRQDQKNDGR